MTKFSIIEYVIVSLRPVVCHLERNDSGVERSKKYFVEISPQGRNDMYKVLNFEFRINLKIGLNSKIENKILNQVQDGDFGKVF